MPQHTFGMRVMPPTSRTSLISLGDTPASFMQALQGPLVRSSSGCTRDSNLARLMLMLRCLAPEASAVMKGRLMSVCAAAESSHLAFSAASRSLWMASLSLDRSMPCNQLTPQSRSLSKSQNSVNLSMTSIIEITGKTILTPGCLLLQGVKRPTCWAVSTTHG